jgi:hypothetical protein
VKDESRREEKRREEKRERTTSITTIAGTSGISTTVQNELNGQVDVDLASLAGDLDAISKSGSGTVGPAAAKGKDEKRKKTGKKRERNETEGE